MAPLVLDRAKLHAAFTFMGDYLKNAGHSCTVVVFGGVTAVYALRNRDVTGDVDFFARHIRDTDPVAYRALREGISAAETHFSFPDPRWMNSMVEAYNTARDEYGQYVVVRDAERQNLVIFEHGGLKILAADIASAISGKLDRLADRDWGDVIALLGWMQRHDSHWHATFASLVGRLRISDDAGKTNALARVLRSEGIPLEGVPDVVI